MAIRRLKTNIAVTVALLVLVSAIFTGVVVILISQGVMVSDYLDGQEELLTGLGAQLLTSSKSGSEFVSLSAPDAPLGILLETMTFPPTLWLDRSCRVRYEYGDAGTHRPLLNRTIGDALSRSAPQHHHIGLRWAVIWWYAESTIVAVPVYHNHKLIGACGAVVPLGPVIARLRANNLPIVLYILFNTIVLTLVGLHRIFRLYLRPIDRMVTQAEAYTDDDFFFTFRREDNELNRLSNALNRMLSRIAVDHQKLQESVASLALANTDLKKAQNDIVQAEKMASVGRLAAGVAHEIGNPIGIVLGYLDLLKQENLDPADHQDFLTRSEKEIQRINTVISQLLNLARPRQSQPRELSAHHVIQDLVATMSTQPMLTEIQITSRLKAETDKIYGDGDQLRQVLLNILINAADAIQELTDSAIGSIVISTINREDPAPSAERWIVIEISDNGPGIPSDQLSTIFDPFFTTKEPGKGTGLGLAVSYTIIEKMGGLITARSTIAKGTTMVITLPLMPE